MKVAISSTGKELESQVSNVFGRCPYFVIAEIEDKEIKNVEAIENTSAKQLGGAGISAAQMVAEKDVKAVITGNLGPRASTVLKQFNIDVYRGADSVKEALRKLIEGNLERIQ